MRNGVLFRKIAYLGALVLLISALILTLSGCDGEKPIVKTEITVEKSEALPYSDSAKATALSVISEMLDMYCEKLGKEPNAQKLASDANALLDISTSYQIPEESYLSCFEVLLDCSDKITDTVKALSEGNISKEALSELLDIYILLSEETTAEYQGEVFFGLCLFAYDQTYNEKMELYESTGGVHHKILAEQVLSGKEIFQSDIGSKNLSQLMHLSYFFQKLFTSGALSEEKLLGFTDAEILIFIKYLDFSQIDIGKAGIMLLCDYYSDVLIAKDTTYLDEIIYEANYNGDIESFASVFDEIISLLSRVQSNLTASDIGMLRSENYEGFISSVFAEFSDEEWELFEEITTINISSGRYNIIAESFFGEEFSEYKNSGIAKNLDELKAAVGSEEFYNALEGYIFGISPAFSYGMRK